MKIKARFETASPPAPPTAPPVVVPPQPSVPAPEPSGKPAVSCAAKNLALAHHLGRLIDRGLIADFTAAARMLGVSQPRLTHLMALLLLAPEIQNAILLGDMPFGEKELRAMARVADWHEQKAMVAARSRGPKTRGLGIADRAIAVG